MRYFFIAGEQSGDLHGSNLINALKITDPKADIVCWGGNLMEKAGAKVLMHYRKTAFMGFLPVLINIRTIVKNMALCKKEIVEYKPDVLILIDYPGFNLRIAEFAKSSGIIIFYYISPKVWAWKESRVEKIRKYVDRMFIIFPFEKEYYRKHSIDVEYYGNPLVDEIEKRTASLGSPDELKNQLGLDNQKIIAMLPGSRQLEVKHILPRMLKAVNHFKGHRFVIAGVNGIPEKLYQKIIGSLPVTILFNHTLELFRISDAALVKSGTSTLEAALMGTPQVVCYRGDPVSFAIARRLVKVRFISLVNLILDREAVRELIQFLLTEKNLVDELTAILPGGEKRNIMVEDYNSLKNILGPSGASDRIASEMYKILNSNFNS
jgi:lipid-A-disaccharide synthase